MGNLSNRKKQQERFLFEQFANATGLQHEIVDSENEAPDLLIHLNGELVGVEVTELFVSDGRTGNSLQAREALAAKIVQKAQSLFEQKGAPYAHVSVHFSLNADLAKLKRDHLAAQIADFVRRQNLHEGRHLSWSNTYEDSGLPDAVSFLNMLAVPSREYAHWYAATAGWVAPLTLQKLQSRIDAKAVRLSQYEERVETNWLLVVGDGSSASRLIRPMPDHPLDGLFSPFDRTIYFGLMHNEVIELSTKKLRPPTQDD